MYIAFRWLFCLSFTMWITLCCLDFIKSLDVVSQDIAIPKVQNKTSCIKRNINKLGMEEFSEPDVINHNFYHYFMFFTASLILYLVHIKRDISLLFRKFYEFNVTNRDFEGLCLKIKLQLNAIAKNVNTKTLRYLSLIREVTLLYVTNNEMFKNTVNFLRRMFLSSHVFKHNFTLIKRFKELNEERKSLGRLLLTTIRENKNIRMRYQLENLAKTRLARYIEDTEKQIKEKRCQYVSFQQLYLATYQENVFLKTRVRKLTKERDNAKKNLVSLINEVCRSKNKELKAFCCQFIVESKENFMKSDVKNEIRQFLKNHTARNQDVLKDEGNNNNLTDIIEQDCLILSEAPRLRGLPGEYVWTVKDKDGLIEKLYECNLHTDCDNGDTIRRIRQYSVYHDQDCLLDYSCSRTFVTDVCQSSGTHMVGNVKCVNYPITRKRFLTGSHAFQKFLEGNNIQ